MIINDIDKVNGLLKLIKSNANFFYYKLTPYHNTSLWEVAVGPRKDKCKLFFFFSYNRFLFYYGPTWNSRVPIHSSDIIFEMASPKLKKILYFNIDLFT